MALTIEVDEKRSRQALRNIARRISRQAKIPGFRPGKAPYHVVARFFGKETLFKEIVDELGDAVYEEALKETGLEPFGQAEITDYETDPLVLKMVVPLAPVVELGDYRQIRLDPEEGADEEEEVNEVLRRIQEQNSFRQPVKRSVQWDDLVIVDIEGTTVKGGAVIDDKGVELILDSDSPNSLPGFSEKLLGMTVNEDREFTLTYPEESEDKELAGQPVHFKVHLQDLKEKVLPDIDDDLARTVGSYETLEDLKAEIRRELQAKAEQEFANRALTAMVEMSEIEFPPAMLAKEVDSWLEELERSLSRQSLSLENYLQMRKLTEEELRTEVAPQVQERLKRSLALSKFVELEGFESESSEVDKALGRLAAIARGEVKEEVQLIPEDPPAEEETGSTEQQAVENE
ncbi:MAG: trigger factor [Anaerolineales bacterium]|nr:trigger factor [Anaerolineales bacterium]